MATAAEMFGALTRFYRGNGEVGLMIKDEVLTDPNLGAVSGSLETLTDEQFLVAFLRTLYANTSVQEFQDDPNNRVVGTSVFPGRQQLGINDPQTFDTYDMTFQVRQPSVSGALPDPDSM